MGKIRKLGNTKKTDIPHDENRDNVHTTQQQQKTTKIQRQRLNTRNK